MNDTVIDAVLNEAVKAGHLPNVVAVVGDRHGRRYAGSAGTTRVGDASAAEVGPDTTYRIASMTKPMTTVAALQQAERGLLDLDAPVADYLPDFGTLQVLDSFDGDVPVYRPPTGQATVRQLLTHTSGLVYDAFSPEQQRWEHLTGTPSVLTGRDATFASPLQFDPGQRWGYGISTDWLGRVVEATSGQGLDKYLTENLTDPLRMTSATFTVGPSQPVEVADVHARIDGRWQPTGVELPASPDWWAGGHGLYCSAADYLTFCRMLLSDGELHGVRVLEPTSVASMFTDQIAPLGLPTKIVSHDPGWASDVEFGPDWTFGKGLALNTMPLPGMRAAFSGCWSGALNTYFWIDRTSGIAGVFCTQALPAHCAAIVEVATQFERAVYAVR